MTAIINLENKNDSYTRSRSDMFLRLWQTWLEEKRSLLSGSPVNLLGEKSLTSFSCL